MERTRRQRGVLRNRPLVTLIAAGYLLVSCGSESAGITPQSAPSATTSPPASPAPSANESVTMRMEFPTDEVAGNAVVEGWIVVNNSTGSPVAILEDGCAPKFRVVLANEYVPADAVFQADCSPQPLVLPVGESRLPIRVQASYGMCSRDAESADGRIPLCVGDTPYAPLPVGSYMATFVGRIPGVVPPEALSIQVTAAGS